MTLLAGAPLREEPGRLRVLCSAPPPTSSIPLHGDPTETRRRSIFASRHRSEIWVSKEGEEVNGKSIMGLMMLAAGKGSTLHLRCEGPDADRAMDELEQLINSKFNED